MAKKKKQDSEESESQGNLNVLPSPENAEGNLPEADNAGNADGEDNSLPPPPEHKGEVLPCVSSAAATITGRSEAEMKNFLATTDYVCRQISTQFAALWPELCKTAAKNSDNGKTAAKVSLSIGVKIDQTNLLIMKTEVSTGFSEKHEAYGETEEDLRQTKFAGF